MSRFNLLILLPAALLLAACQAGSEPVEESWEAQLASWKQSRVESLNKNWASLAGLYWLEEGEATFGSGAGNDVVFPSDLPERIGTLTLRSGVVRMDVEEGVDVRHEGEPVTSVELVPDTEEDPTEVVLGDYEWYAIERDGVYGIRLHDRGRTPDLTVDDLPFYPVDSAWRLPARFEPYEPARTVPVPTIMGTLSDMAAPGRISFEIDGETYQLDVLEGSATRYFVMFADRTNRTETYEAGRYVYIDHENEDGETIIDFNQSYNPPCAFTPYATCPFPPPQNRLAVEIDAGEKRIDSKS